MAGREDQNQPETNHPVDENDLEQYGVWVKAGPEDVIEAEAEDEAFALADLAEADLAGDELGTTVAEADELPSLDESDELTLESLDEELPAEGEDSGEAEIEELTLEVEDEEIELGTLESDLDLGELEEQAEEDASEPSRMGPPPDTGDELVDSDLTIDEDLPDDLTLDLDELDVDSFDEPMTGASEEPEEIETLEAPDDELSEVLEEEVEELDLEIEEADETEETAESVAELDIESLPAGDEDFAEITLEEIAEDEEELPELVVEDDAVLEETSEEVLPIDSDDEDELTELTLDEAFEPEGISEEEPSFTVDSPAEDLLEDDLLGPGLATAEEEPEGDLLEEIDLEGDLLDLSDSAELADETPLAGAPEELVEPAIAVAEDAYAPGSASGDQSISILESIEKELASIRDELGELKQRVSSLGGAERVQATVPAAGEDEDAAGGFFEGSEDEDETIALTGSELDNIMKTAEFVEETGESDDVEDFLGPVGDADLLDSLGDEDESGSELTEIALDDSGAESGSIDLDLNPAEPDALAGSDEEVEALASMDIDAELADIEELEDTSDDLSSESEDALPDIDLGGGVPDEGVVFDAEPLGEDAAADDDLSVPPPFPSEPAIPPAPVTPVQAEADTALPDNLKSELRSVLTYMDQLLESLPEEKIIEFSKSDHFAVYRKLFDDLGVDQ
jgi:hypothetical protein